MKIALPTVLGVLIPLLLLLSACSDSEKFLAAQDVVLALDTLDSNGDPSHTFGAGEPVTLVLTIENSTSEPHTFMTGCEPFVAQVRTGGELAWQNYEVCLAIETFLLAPGGATVRSLVWDQTVIGGHAGPGTYSTRGLLHSIPLASELASNDVEFVIE